jgi:hypothetical protein
MPRLWAREAQVTTFDWCHKCDTKHDLDQSCETVIHWLTTNANPRLPGWTEQHGWKLHAVELPAEAKFSQARGRSALCGLVARHGWGLDLFIEAKCERCERKANAIESTQTRNGLSEPATRA